jgi:hypothetical protein
MTENTPSPLSNVITIDDERIKSHLDRVVRGSVEETLNALLDAEADRLCNAQRYERSEARRDTHVQLKAVQLAAHDFNKQIKFFKVSNEVELEKAFARFGRRRHRGVHPCCRPVLREPPRPDHIVCGFRAASPVSTSFANLRNPAGLRARGAILAESYRQAGIYAGKY